MDWQSELDALVLARARGSELSLSQQELLHSFLPTGVGDRAYAVLPLVYPQLATLDIPINCRSLWCLYLPLAIYLTAQTAPFVLGIFGMQGTGKTTLTRVLQIAIQVLGKTAITLSLDDLYKTYADRLTLQKSDPRLRWRGVPSTHDIDLGIEVLSSFQQGIYPLKIPRFDKSLHNGHGDRTTPEIVNNPADILLFEGWFVGLKPLPASAFSQSQQFAIDCNSKLADYQQLWQFIDYLLALIPEDYTISLAWRSQAEMQQKEQGKGAMSPAEIKEFVQYFWQALPPDLFLPSISTYADMVVLLRDDRTILEISRVSNQ